MLRAHKFNPLRNNVITVRQDCCQPCPISLDGAEVTISNTPLDVNVTNPADPVDLTTLENNTSGILTELQNQPQIEGVHTQPVCFDDNTSGFAGITLDEETGTYTVVLFDDQYVQVTGKVIVECEQDPTVFLGDPIEVCSEVECITCDPVITSSTCTFPFCYSADTLEVSNTCNNWVWESAPSGDTDTSSATTVEEYYAIIAANTTFSDIVGSENISSLALSGFVDCVEHLIRVRITQPGCPDIYSNIVGIQTCA